MATLKSVKMEDLIKHYSLEEKQLDTEISSQYFHDITLFLSEWRLLASVLKGMGKPDIEAIERDNTKEENKRHDFLVHFKRKLAMKATYRELIRALLTIERADEAGKMCELLKNIGEYFHS